MSEAAPKDGPEEIPQNGDHMSIAELDTTSAPEAPVDLTSRFNPTPLNEFLEQDVPRRDWAIEGVWAEKTSGIIAGPPKAGKSTLSLELAITLASGTPFLGRPEFPLKAMPARVTYVQAENSDRRVRRDLDSILEARGLGFMQPVYNPLDNAETSEPEGDRFQPGWEGDGPDLAILSHPGLDLMDPEHQRWVLDHAAARDYLFFDPVYLLASANPNDTGQMMQLLAFLSQVRDRADCALIFTHQMSDKHSGGSAASRLLGSTFMHGWYESAIFNKRCSDDLFGSRSTHCGRWASSGPSRCSASAWASGSASRRRRIQQTRSDARPPELERKGSRRPGSGRSWRKSRIWLTRSSASGSAYRSARSRATRPS